MLKAWSGAIRRTSMLLRRRRIRVNSMKRNRKVI